MIKILTIVGSRPQIIKASVLSNLIKKEKNIQETILHTGQHFDFNMSEIFFKELYVPKPKYHLNIKSFYHGEMVAKMMIKIEKILLNNKFDLILLYGDTNSTLAGALAVSKFNIPIAHVEAGIRSFNKKMPEEINRVLTDHCSSILFVPSKVAKKNLINEGINLNLIKNVGDIMFDLFNKNFYEKVKKTNDILVTIHRPENTNSRKKLLNITENLNNLSSIYKIVFPIHPRTLKALKKFNLLSKLNKKIKIIKPLSYKNNMKILIRSKLLITDSGGMQKEAFYAKVQTITVRDQTEWPETVQSNWNRLVKPKYNNIYKSAKMYFLKTGKNTKPYGRGNTAVLILNYIKKILKNLIVPK